MNMHHPLVERLSCASVRKRFDAHQDIAWDAPEHRIDPDDERWELGVDDALAETTWYRALPTPTRSRLGLHMVVHKMALGVHFERVLARGLLELADELPLGSPDLRYAYHELIEEAQHSLMFAELVRRSGMPVQRQSALERWAARGVVRLGRTFPELFFLFVLGGEAPIDHSQRQALARGAHGHPLLRRIMQIHVTEEARHLCFAESFLRDRVPRLGRLRMLELRIRTPLIFKAMTEQMLRPPPDLVKRYRIPASVVRAAYTESATHRAHVLDGLGAVRELCSELGIVTPAFAPVWRLLRIWPSV